MKLSGFTLELNQNDNWKNVLSHLKHTTIYSKLMWFNNKIIHKILGTNKSLVLYMAKIKTAHIIPSVIWGQKN